MRETSVKTHRRSNHSEYPHPNILSLLSHQSLLFTSPTTKLPAQQKRLSLDNLIILPVQHIPFQLVSTHHLNITEKDMLTRLRSRKMALGLEASQVASDLGHLSPEKAPPKPSQKVWEIDDLLLEIATHFSPNHLIKLRQVDHRTRKIVDEEPSLQRRAHLLPDFSDPTNVKVIQWFPQGYSNLQTVDGKRTPSFPITISPTMYLNPPVSSAGPHRRSLWPGSYGQRSHLWGKMFVTQPPVREISCEWTYGAFVVASQTGVTLGDLYKACRVEQDVNFVRSKFHFGIKGEAQICVARDFEVGQTTQ